ncbi:hypothetical protein FQN54_009408 [Arachnomyces sp. PD_36]|nr:hypothetical protein FQN54_009408 [Arachnomyces sp. PD_36]
MDEMDPHDGMTTPTPRPIPPKNLPPQEPSKKQILQEDSGNKGLGGVDRPEQHTNWTMPLSNNGSTVKKGSMSPKKEEERVSPAHSSLTGEEVAVDSDGERDGSEMDTDNGESGPPSKKKKGQRFFCTEFPPCTLSFTRSEHLARHIRKHTGERPFQCHCQRRFSRLDNLRQHAQTVHVNEEIPGDSLAATGTRFQRQIRTDRVRPPGRARAGTGGSQGGHSRGHSRNLSTSSIGSTTSTFSQNQELRSRPPQLLMSNDGSSGPRLSVDTMMSSPRTPGNHARRFSIQSPGGYTTPTSSTFSSIVSPEYSSTASSATRDTGNSARRLSFPSGTNPFQPPHGQTYPAPYVNPLAPPNAPFASSSGSASSTIFSSPTANQDPSKPQDEPSAEADWRRRTWHPSSHSNLPRPATSGLSYQRTPEGLQPGFAPSSSSQTSRLPGIESFDQMQQRPSTPRHRPTPMEIDGPSPLPATPGFSTQTPSVRPAPPISGPGHRRGHLSWDMTLHSNLTRLDLHGGTPKRDSNQWGQQTIGENEDTSSRPPPAYQPPYTKPSFQEPQRPVDRYSTPGSDNATPRSNKRHAWYDGQRPSSSREGHATRTSPEDSSSSEGVATPSTSAVEYHPAIVHSSGYIEGHRPSLSADISRQSCDAPQPPQTHGYPPNPEAEARHSSFNNWNASSQPGGMGRLEALVAVATSEEQKKDNGKFF